MGGLAATARLAAMMLACAASAGCSTLAYYAHVTRGELALLAHRKPVARVLADPDTDPELRLRLAGAEAARRFASDHLLLPRNRSYTSYVDLGRPYVTWNVFATPEFSVDPVSHCFAFAGCVAYVGYFDRARAEREAKRLAAAGNDTAIEGTAAYSTLGWFADPILSSMLHWSDDELDGVIFHELAHQVVYVADDTAFNESFATFVQEQGLREWRASRGLAAEAIDDRTRDDAFTALALDLRERLRALYATPSPADELRAAKQRAFDDFRTRYRHLRDDEWHGDGRYDAFMHKPLNNARLVPFGLYDRWVPAFAVVFDETHADWRAFYAAVRELAQRAKTERDAALDARLRDAEAKNH